MTALIIILTLFALGILFVRRASAVNDFRDDLAEQCAEKNIECIELDPFGGSMGIYLDLPDYNTMLFSTKPLTIEVWLSEDDIKLLNT